jgi:hypothetical protein
MLGLPKDPLLAQAGQLGNCAILLHSLEKNLRVYGRVYAANLYNPKRQCRADTERILNAGHPLPADFVAALRTTCRRALVELSRPWIAPQE